MFRVKPHDPKPLIWWYAQRAKIDMDPSYQREGQLWDKEKKSRLIDSVLNDFDVPKIYLADFNPIASKLNEHKRAYAVIDGKQRLETFLSFSMVTASRCIRISSLMLNRSSNSVDCLTWT